MLLNNLEALLSHLVPDVLEVQILVQQLRNFVVLCRMDLYWEGAVTWKSLRLYCFKSCQKLRLRFSHECHIDRNIHMVSLSSSGERTDPRVQRAQSEE